jgi:DNA repair protein RadC
MATAENISILKTLLGSEKRATVAAAYLATCRDVPTEDAVRKATGFGPVIAKKVVAAAKASACYMLNSRPQYLGSADMVAWYLSDIKLLGTETLVVLTLAADNTLIGRHVCSTGSGHNVAVDPSTVYRHAIQDGANAVIVAHNHPSGSLDVSEGDKEFTSMLARAGRTVKVRFLDSIIVSTRGYRSIRDECPELFK